MKRIRLLWYLATALIRGYIHRWPNQPRNFPEWHSGCSCCIPMKDVPDMYFRHGWRPYCIQKTPYGKRWVKLFAIPMTPEDIEYEKYIEQSYLKMAEEKPLTD